MLPTERLSLYRQALRQLREEQFSLDLPDSQHAPELEQFETELLQLATWMDLRFSEFTQLQEISAEISQGCSPEEVLTKIYDSFSPLIPYDRIGCALLSQDNQNLRAFWAKARYSTPQKIRAGFSAPMEGSSLKPLLDSQSPRILNDLELYLTEHPDSTSTRMIIDEGIRSSLTCPLIADGKPLGFLFFSSQQPNTYQAIHQKIFIYISKQVAALIEKSRLYQQINELNQQLTSALEQLKEQAIRDPLTGILHRGGITEFLSHTYQLARRNAQPFSIMMADLDHFKAINDNYGHLTGDEVLRKTTATIQSQLRACDALGRYGGEEFLLILNETTAEEAQEIAERIRSAVESIRFEHEHTPFKATLSIGIASSPAGQCDTPIPSLLANADTALYKAKKSGRNRCCLHQ